MWQLRRVPKLSQKRTNHPRKRQNLANLVVTDLYLNTMCSKFLQELVEVREMV
jgi:hypothetical protein